MIRTTPDPVFASAARAELERRVRAARPDAGAITVSLPFRPRRAWRTELVAIGGVLVLVAGVALGVQALRPALTSHDGPAIATTQTAEPFPTGSPTAVPTTATPTPPPATTPPPAPVTTPPPATTPPPSTPTATTPPPASSTGLIGATGAKVRSEAELRAWGRSIGNGDIWIEQLVLDTKCMASRGFIYDAQFEYSASLAAQRAGMTDAQYADYQEAMNGPQTGAPYDWRTAGCHGRSVHLTGQDHAN